MENKKTIETAINLLSALAADDVINKSDAVNSARDLTKLISEPKESSTVTDSYKYCNHHHEITDEYELVDFGDGKFVANKAAIPLLKSLNEAGLRTRTHHYDGKNSGFISILLDNVRIEIKTVNEIDADRYRYDGKKELLIQWNKKEIQ